MSGGKHPTECACGLVVFAVNDRKDGETLTCPWCERTYRYAGGEKLEPLSGPKRQGGTAKEKAPGRNGESTPDKPHDAPKRASVRLAAEMAAARVADAALRRHDTVRMPTRRPKEIPGGVMRMVVFMVVFDALAFVALAYVLLPTPDHGRHPFWSDTHIPKSAIWPEIVTILIGQTMGFLAWSWSVYRLHRKKLLAAHPEAHLKLDPEAAARRKS